MLGHYFGPVSSWPDQDLVGFTDGVDANLAIAGYVSGVFPMPLHESGFSGVGWWAPVRRGILPPTRLRISSSLRKSMKRYSTTIDLAFERVLDGCADPRRPYGWIDDTMRAVYVELHRAGRAHSVETWDADGRLVGGLYGVSVLGLFAGESMFHDQEYGRDASKTALVRLVEQLGERQAPVLLDVQWLTPHLASLGAVEVTRSRYLELLDAALTEPEIPWPGTRIGLGDRLSPEDHGA